MANIYWILIALIYSGLQYRKFIRDEDELRDIYAIGKVIPPYTTVGISDETCINWGFQCYLERYLAVGTVCNNQQKYYLVEKKNRQPGNPGFKIIDLPTVKFNLYLKN